MEEYDSGICQGRYRDNYLLFRRPVFMTILWRTCEYFHGMIMLAIMNQPMLCNYYFPLSVKSSTCTSHVPLGHQRALSIFAVYAKFNTLTLTRRSRMDQEFEKEKGGGRAIAKFLVAPSRHSRRQSFPFKKSKYGQMQLQCPSVIFLNLGPSRCHVLASSQPFCEVTTTP